MGRLGKNMKVLHRGLGGEVGASEGARLSRDPIPTLQDTVRALGALQGGGSGHPLPCVSCLGGHKWLGMDCIYEVKSPPSDPHPGLRPGPYSPGLN